MIVDEANDIVVSAVSAWEIATKFRIGRLPGSEAVAVDVAGHIAGQGFVELAISVADAECAGRLPGPHRDPFDRMLVAQGPWRANCQLYRSMRCSISTASIGCGNGR